MWLIKARVTKYIGAVLGMILITGVIYNALPRTPKVVSDVVTVFENDVLKVERIGAIDQLAIAYNRDGRVYAAEDHFIYESLAEDQVFSELGHFNKVDPSALDKIKDFVARLRITRDFRGNFGTNNIVVLQNDTILVFFDKIYRSTDKGRSFQAVYDFKKSKVVSPFNHGIAVDKNGDIYFGEYSTKPRPHNIKIIKGSNDGTHWATFHEFPAGELFHIHMMRYDPFRNVVWIAAGDTNDESKLMYIDQDRKAIKHLGGGDQGWRIVSLIMTDNFLYWCSDNDQTGSHVYKYNFSTNKRERLRFVGKPSYYSTKLNDGTLVFSTTYEPSSPYTKSEKPDNSTDLWLSKNGDKWYKVYSVEGKIEQKYWGLTRPNMLLPSGDYSSKHVFLSPTSTTELDFSTQILRVIWTD